MYSILSCALQQSQTEGKDNSSSYVTEHDRPCMLTNQTDFWQKVLCQG